MNYNVDIAVIGGGASGLVSAITAKRTNPNLSVYIFEALDRVGKKLITTGNGRCNITNKSLVGRFHGEDIDFAFEVFHKVRSDNIKDFFLSIGLPFTYEGDKAYPASLQASSVVDCLRFECERLGVVTVCGFKVNKINFGREFMLSADGGTINAKSVICATGLYSGGEKLGSDGSFFRLLKDHGFKTVKLSPSIVQLKTETDFVKQLKGIKVDAVASLLKNGKLLKSEFGEVLFCDYGLSGPAILNISRDALRTEGNFEVTLDLYPNINKTELEEMLIARAKTLSRRKLEDFFTGMLNKRLGQVVLKVCSYSLQTEARSLTDNDFKTIAGARKGCTFKVLGNTGFINSQATAGGVSTDEFSSVCLMSKKIKGLFACGELLDIDGDCGGFNLTWAWASGILAGKKCAEYLG